jgi:hypothetical protein
MIRQYRAHHRRGGVNPLGVGVIATGSIYYLQDRGFFHDRFGGEGVCRNPWVVEGLPNGSCAVARRNRDTGRRSQGPPTTSGLFMHQGGPRRWRRRTLTLRLRLAPRIPDLYDGPWRPVIRMRSCRSRSGLAAPSAGPWQRPSGENGGSPMVEVATPPAPSRGR